MIVTQIKITTRRSPLALWQAEFIRNNLLSLDPTLKIELVGIKTLGDKNQQQALNAIGGKSLFVKELQQALLDRQADIAVHCIKDMSVHPYPGLNTTCICKREDPRDVFVSNHYSSLKDLPRGATIGTSSPRRQSQIKSFRPDLNIKVLRGNVQTRLSKLDAGDYDGIILAAAGLTRLSLTNRINDYLNTTTFIPAIGQGALGIECRADDTPMKNLLQKLNHSETQYCVQAEQAVNQRLGGNCYSPIAAHAILNPDNQSELILQAMVGSSDGQQILTAQHVGHFQDAEKIGLAVAEQLIAKGAKNLLKQ